MRVDRLAQGTRSEAQYGSIRMAGPSLPGRDVLMRRLLPLNPDAGLLILRIVLGIIMIYHGWPKVTGLGGVIEGFSGMGIPLPAVAAVFATVAEFVGGLLMLIGAFTDIAGLMFAIDMLGAIIFVHAKNGFGIDKGGFEWPLLLMAAALAIALAGPGKYSAAGPRGGGAVGQ
jgi:putative oxidoreductase